MAMTMRTLIVTGFLCGSVCMAGAAPGQEMDDEARTVLKLFTTAFADQCYWGNESDFLSEPPARWTLEWQEEWSDRPQTLTLYQLYCFSGAYNVNHVYYTVSPDDLEGIQPVSFARPAFDVVYADPDDLESAVVSIDVSGMTASTILTNSEFDAQTGMLTSHALWRGIGDASSGGAWAFDKGQFVLKRFDVDASYDAEFNAIRITDYTQPVSVSP